MSLLYLLTDKSSGYGKRGAASLTDRKVLTVNVKGIFLVRQVDAPVVAFQFARDIAEKGKRIDFAANNTTEPHPLFKTFSIFVAILRDYI